MIESNNKNDKNTSDAGNNRETRNSKPSRTKRTPAIAWMQATAVTPATARMPEIE